MAHSDIEVDEGFRPDYDGDISFDAAGNLLFSSSNRDSPGRAVLAVLAEAHFGNLSALYEGDTSPTINLW